MAKKKTKLEKMSKKERTSLAYALATNLAKHGKPQSPTNERKLTKGEEKKKEKHVMKFKKAFDLEEINQIKEELKNSKNANIRLEDSTGKILEEAEYTDYSNKELVAYCKNNPKDKKAAEELHKRSQALKNLSRTDIDENKEELKNPKKADLNKDGKLSSYEKKRGAAIEKAVQKEDLDIGHQDNEPHMLKKDLYRIAKYAAELYKMVDQFDVEGQEVDFPQWWQAKIITSKEAMVKAKHYLDGELTVPQIDATLEEEMGINDPILMKLRADKMRREKEANMPKPIAPKMKKNNSAKIALLQKERERLMRDMEQEAEPEGGPIADRYGAELNRIDKAIAKLKA